MLKHSESSGFVCLDELSQDKNGMLECYVRAHVNQAAGTEFEGTANMLFEVEKDMDSMEDSGTALEWNEDPESGHQVCKVRLRHFISGRLI